ncbi:galactose mutarotase [Leptinotarsa decemlineata]|uniref:galactose mutarotase n=1 Tax=Leptinotarsa decemlineata TaxID=7539 RepID=UPI003D30630B
MENNSRKSSQISENISEKLVKIHEGVNETVQEKIFDNGVLNLTEDVFGYYWDKNGVEHAIKRFTWRNKNKITIQVINYGARITSIKLPDRKGEVEDIVLGFDDLPGYIYHKNFYFGATIGRTTNLIRNSSFNLNNKKYPLTENHPDGHHKHGGKHGLDQVVWNTYVENSEVIMSYVSPNMSEGYPGDLYIRITFELSVRNEFKIQIEASTTEPTIVNLSNLTYFNLAGHQAGPEEIYKHILTMNCNCFTPQVNDLTTGEISNVIHSQYDFQIPKILGKIIGIVPKDGFNQNLCINRGMNQEECFVGRVLHPPSGRMLEIYSNQYGVNISTANEFGSGILKSMQEIYEEQSIEENTSETTLKLLNDIHQRMSGNLKIDETNDFKELKNVILKIRNMEKKSPIIKTPSNTPVQFTESSTKVADFVFTSLQISYLKNILEVIGRNEFVEDCDWLKSTIDKILKYGIIRDGATQSNFFRESKGGVSSSKTHSFSPKKSINENKIPLYYKNTNQVVGKERKIYRMHGGIAIQTQNYPGCESFKSFPTCVLNPNENYKHTITYKFWIRAGNPNRWVKRNMTAAELRNQKETLR